MPGALDELDIGTDSAVAGGWSACVGAGVAAAAAALRACTGSELLGGRSRGVVMDTVGVTVTGKVDALDLPLGPSADANPAGSDPRDIPSPLVVPDVDVDANAAVDAVDAGVRPLTVLSSVVCRAIAPSATLERASLLPRRPERTGPSCSSPGCALQLLACGGLVPLPPVGLTALELAAEADGVWGRETGRTGRSGKGRTRGCGCARREDEPACLCER